MAGHALDVAERQRGFLGPTATEEVRERRVLAPLLTGLRSWADAHYLFAAPCGDNVSVERSNTLLLPLVLIARRSYSDSGTPSVQAL